MTIAVVLSCAIATVLLTAFKYRSEKKKSLQRTWKSVFAEVVTQILTVLLSALIALTVNSYAENKKKDLHIIRFLEIAEDELSKELDYFSSDKDISLQGDIYSGLIVGSYNKRNLKLTDILFSDRFIDRIDVAASSQISVLEFQYEDSTALLQQYLGKEADESGRKPDHDLILQLAEDVVRYNVALIDQIECEKTYLMGRKYEKSGDDITKHIPEDVRKKYDAFREWIKAVSSDSPDAE